MPAVQEKAGIRGVPDPCRVGFGSLVRVHRSGRVVPLNDGGADLLDVLDLNDPVLSRFRLEMTQLVRRLRADGTPAGRSRLAFWLGLPDDLPDLSRLRPPDGNGRPDGIRDSYFARRLRGELSAEA